MSGNQASPTSAKDIAHELWQNDRPASLEDLAASLQERGERLQDGAGIFQVIALEDRTDGQELGLWWLHLRRGGTTWEIDSEAIVKWEGFLDQLRAKGLTPRDVVGSTIELEGPESTGGTVPLKFEVVGITWTGH